MPIREAQADIKTYLNTNLPDFVGRPEMEKLEVQAAGLFIYAATVVRYLAGYTPVEQEERLKSIPLHSDSAPPQTSEEETPLLDCLYLQVLSDAFCSFKGVYFMNRLHILHSFLCSVEHTSTTLVAELLFPPNKNKTSPFPYTPVADKVLSCLHAVLYTENDKVLSYHKSFTDFVFNQGRAKEFWCDQAKHHSLLTDCCFRVMANSLKFNIANITTSFVLDRDNSALPDAVKWNVSTVLSYSCRNWDYHVSAVALTESDVLCGTLLEFLQLRVLFWIEVMNLLGSRSLCDRML